MKENKLVHDSTNRADNGANEGDVINKSDSDTTQNNAGQSGGKEANMNDRMRAVQIINKLSASEMLLGREYTRGQLDEHVQQFAEACESLSVIPDEDVQMVLAVLLRDRHVHNIGSSKGWRRLIEGA